MYVLLKKVIVVNHFNNILNCVVCLFHRIFQLLLTGYPCLATDTNILNSLTNQISFKKHPLKYTPLYGKFSSTQPPDHYPPHQSTAIVFSKANNNNSFVQPSAFLDMFRTKQIVYFTSTHSFHRENRTYSLVKITIQAGFQSSPFYFQKAKMFPSKL